MKQIRKRVFAALLSAAIACSWCVSVGAVSCRHKNVDAEVITEATCTENGELASEGTCLDCGETVKVKKTTIKKLGHEFSDWQMDAEAHWKVCERCGEIDDEGKHSFKNGACKTCGCADQTVDIVKLGTAQNPEFTSWGKDEVAIFFEDPEDTTGIASYIVEMYKGGKWHSATRTGMATQQKACF